MPIFCHAAAPMPVLPRVSIIIPVRNNTSGLARCLDALRTQTYPFNNYEILVVDNGSTDDIATLHSVYPEVRWLADSGPGSYSARNAGLQHATGDVIAFTDSDCVPEPTWLERGVAALSEKSATVIGGNVDHFNPVERPLNSPEVIEILISRLPNIEFLIKKLGVASTGNLFVERSAFARVGEFDARLKSNGDGEWTQRAVRGGEKLAYGADAVVWHPRRSTFAAVSQKYRRFAGGRITILKRQNAWLGVVGQLWSLSLLDPRLYISIATPLVRGPAARLDLLRHGIRLSLALTAEKFRVLFGADPARD